MSGVGIHRSRATAPSMTRARPACVPCTGTDRWCVSNTACVGGKGVCGAPLKPLDMFTHPHSHGPPPCKLAFPPTHLRHTSDTQPARAAAHKNLYTHLPPPVSCRGQQLVGLPPPKLHRALQAPETRRPRIPHWALHGGHQAVPLGHLGVCVMCVPCVWVWVRESVCVRCAVIYISHRCGVCGLQQLPQEPAHPEAAVGGEHSAAERAALYALKCVCVTVCVCVCVTVWVGCVGESTRKRRTQCLRMSLVSCSVRVCVWGGGVHVCARTHTRLRMGGILEVCACVCVCLTVITQAQQHPPADITHTHARTHARAHTHTQLQDACSSPHPQIHTHSRSHTPPKCLL